MTLDLGQLSLVLTPLAPLALAVLMAWRPAQAWCVPLAPFSFLPALAAVLFRTSDARFDWLLLGTHLSLDQIGRSFLLLSAVSWTLAALFARVWLAEDPARARFFGFFLAAAAGNLGVCVAQDLASFYLSFALMTFSAWGMVLHRGTSETRRAGRVYIALAVIGEAALLAALLLIASHGDVSVVDAPAAVATSATRDLTMMLLLVGFGVKTGVLGLHVALPLAYGATPAPGAAALASAMIKAGVLGWLRFLPLGHGLSEWGAVFVALGMAAAFYGVGIGLAQREPKVILAYSSISQMGLIMVGIGAALAATAPQALALFAVSTYALHHAFAKAALFFGEALARGAVARRWIVVGLALPAAALAGAPFTSGALAKHLLKAAVATTPWSALLSQLLSAAAVGTTVLMCRFLWCAWRAAPAAQSPTSLVRLAVPWILTLACVLGVGLVLHWPPTASMDDVLPIALGILASFAAMRFVHRSFTLPPGDVLTVVESLLRAAQRMTVPHISTGRVRAPRSDIVAHAEHILGQWSVVGLTLLLLLGVLMLLLAFGSSAGIPAGVMQDAFREVSADQLQRLDRSG